MAASKKTPSKKPATKQTATKKAEPKKRSEAVAPTIALDPVALTNQSTDAQVETLFDYLDR